MAKMINDIIEALAAFGCGLAGIPYPYEESI
jgi:hypothetical protein